MIILEYLRERSTKARAKFATATAAYNISNNKFDNFDKGYWLGFAHALESTIDAIEHDELDDTEV